MQHVAIYCRVSTDDQNNARQLGDLSAWADRLGVLVVARYFETASGTKANRVQRSKCLQEALQRRFDAILVTECSRWSRSLPDLLHSLDKLASVNVSLLALNGPSFDMATPTGRLMAGIIGSFAQFERDLIAERTRSGLAAARARGVTLGRPHGSSTIAKHKAQVATMLADNVPVRKIARALGISTSSVMSLKSQLRNSHNDTMSQPLKPPNPEALQKRFTCN